MNKTKKLLAAASVAAVLLSGVSSQPVAEAKAHSTAKTAQPVQSQPEAGYTYTSKVYGYTIQCPKKPNVIPASMLYEGKKGEVLIFDNDGYNIRNAWVILTNAFDDKKIPNLNKLKEDDAKKYLSELMSRNGYEGVMLINLSASNKAIYAITAKTVDIDTDGDGKVDATATANSQMAVTFFRGNKNGRYSVQLIDNPVLRDSALKDFQKGVVSFRE
jgi:hypothetical protein